MPRPNSSTQDKGNNCKDTFVSLSRLICILALSVLAAAKFLDLGRIEMTIAVLWSTLHAATKPFGMRVIQAKEGRPRAEASTEGQELSIVNDTGVARKEAQMEFIWG